MIKIIPILATFISLNCWAPHYTTYGGTSWDFTAAEKQMIVASDAAADDLFGTDVDIYNNYLIVGAPERDDWGLDSGTAYIFEKNNTWDEKTKLSPDVLAPTSRFGWSVSINEQWAFAGAPGANLVYVFKKNNHDQFWPYSHKLTPSGSPTNFGNNLLLHGDTLFVSTRNVVYVFNFDPVSDKWVESQILTNPTPGAIYDDNRGSISAFGDLLMVGVTDDLYGSLSGAVLSYHRNKTDGKWNLEEIIRPADAPHFPPGEQIEFGHSVAVGDQVAIIGSAQWVDISLPPGTDMDSGRAYFFNRLPSFQWVESIGIRANDYYSSKEYGWLVAIRHNLALVSDTYYGDIDENFGKVWLYLETSPDTWEEVATIEAGIQYPRDHFGHSLSVSDSTIAVGSHMYGSEDKGAVFIYSIDRFLIENDETNIPINNAVMLLLAMLLMAFGIKRKT